MTECNKRVAILLAVLFGGGGLVCLVCGVFGIFQMEQFGEQAMRDAERTIPEADAFAGSHDQLACRDESFRRSDLCGPTELSCITQVTVFMEECLRRCAATPGFCDGVPRSTEIMAGATWARTECAELGRQADPRCPSMMQSVQHACDDSAR